MTKTGQTTICFLLITYPLLCILSSHTTVYYIIDCSWEIVVATEDIKWFFHSSVPSLLTCYKNVTHITKLYQPFVKEWQLQFISISFHYYLIAEIYSRKMFEARKWQIQLSLIFFLIMCQCLFLMNGHSTNVEKCTEHFMFYAFTGN